MADAVERARSKLEYTPLAAAFCEEPFTIAQLRSVYEIVWGEALDPAEFRRAVLSTPGFVQLVGETVAAGTGGSRPDDRYERGTADVLHPALLRPSKRAQ